MLPIEQRTGEHCRKRCRSCYLKLNEPRPGSAVLCEDRLLMRLAEHFCLKRRMDIAVRRLPHIHTEPGENQNISVFSVTL
jgi:hypothetical protein